MKLILSAISIFLLSNISFGQKNISLPASAGNTELLEKIFEGKFDAETESIKWKASAADIAEYNGLFGNSYLYTKADKVVKDGNSVLLIFHTSPMVKDEDGKMTDANSCHACGTTFGYAVFEKSEDSLVLTRLKRNFGQHGSFGASNYKVSTIDLKDGYNLIRIDETYSGMGQTSTSTSLYYDGDMVLNMISAEDIKGNKEKNEKGYYEFKTQFSFNTKNKTITAVQTGFKINETTSKREVTNKKKVWAFDATSMQF